MDINLFEFGSYKKYLASYIKLYKRRGIVSELAGAAGCDRTYFSQVMSGKAQFTADQAVSLADTLGMTSAEQDYFLHLVLYERASSSKARSLLRSKLNQLVEDSLELAKKIKNHKTTDELTDDEKGAYYQNYLFAAAHILTSIKEFQTVPAISERLSISQASASEVLKSLVSMGLVKAEGGRFVHSGALIHIGRGTPFNVLNHLHWRSLAVGKSNSKDAVHYTNVFAISRKDWDRLKSNLLAFIADQRTAIHASGAEEIFCFCCDLFSP